MRLAGLPRIVPRIDLLLYGNATIYTLLIVAKDKQFLAQKCESHTNFAETIGILDQKARPQLSEVHYTRQINQKQASAKSKRGSKKNNGSILF